MADENPIAVVKDELAATETAIETGDETAERERIEKEAREKAEREAAENAEHEKRGEEIKALDDRVTKLSEDIESWKTQTLSAVEKTTAELQQSIHELSEAQATRPEPVQPQNPLPPVPPETETPASPPSVEAGRPAAKTDKETPRKRNLRFL